GLPRSEGSLRARPSPAWRARLGRSPGGPGCLPVPREAPPFSEHERHLIEQVARLAQASPDLLRRLHEMFLHRRKVRQTLRPDEVLKDYGFKLCLLLHPRHLDPLLMPKAEPRRELQVPSASKLVTPSGTPLPLGAPRATDPV